MKNQLKQLSENSEVFVIKKLGDKKLLIKMAPEIARESDIISRMGARDAKTIGYALASCKINQEKIGKNRIKNKLKYKQSSQVK